MKIALRNTTLIAFLFFTLLGLIPIEKSYAQWGSATGANPANRTYFGVTCPTPPNDFKDFACIVLDIVELTTIYAASSAFLAFIWGLSKFILGAGNEEKIAEGKMIMKWGVIGLFFMFCIWGVMWAISLGLGFTFGLPLLPQ